MALRRQRRTGRLVATAGAAAAAVGWQSQAPLTLVAPHSQARLYSALGLWLGLWDWFELLPLKLAATQRV
jgi:hypothetical protein